MVVGNESGAQDLSTAADVPVLVPTDPGLVDAAEVWGLLLERSERAAVARAERAAALARIATQEISSGAGSARRLLAWCMTEINARLQILLEDSEVPKWGPDWPELHEIVSNVGHPVFLDQVVAVPAGARGLRTVLLAERTAEWDEDAIGLLQQVAEWASAILWSADIDDRSRTLADRSRALRVAAFQAIMSNDMSRAARALDALAPGLVDAGAGTVAVVEAHPGESRTSLLTAIDHTVGRQTLTVMCPVNDRQVIALHPSGAGRIEDLIRPVVISVRGRAAGVSPMTPWPRAASAYEAAKAALTEARGTLDKISCHSGGVPLVELLGADARVWAALVLQPLPNDTARAELLNIAGETLQWGESEAARLVGWHRHTLADRLTVLFNATGFDRTDIWHRSALYLAVRLSQLPPPLVIDRRVTLEDVLNHDGARAWARDLLKPLSPEARRVLVAWARCEPRPAKAMQDLAASGHPMSRATFYRRLGEASQGTRLEFALYPGPLAEILLALHIAGDVPMGTLPSMSARNIDPEGLDATLGSVEELNSGTPHPARVYDYFLGGRTHFAADRAAARAVQEINPYTAFACQQSRVWIHKAVAHVVRQGVDQILDIGTGIPTSPTVHEVAQEINRGVRRQRPYRAPPGA